MADCKTGCIAGLDEAGRGPLAGPVVAGAVILNPNSPIRNLADSKVLTEKRRERLAEEILLKSVGWSVAWSDSTEIDQINILSNIADEKKIALISHGKMFHKCFELYNQEPDKFICIDISEQ